MRKLFILLSMTFVPYLIAADSSITVYAVEEVNPLKNIRIEVNNKKVRTNNDGTVTFNFNEGKYQFKGPNNKVDGWVVNDAETIAVLQEANLLLKVNREDFGRYPYEGKTYTAEVIYSTPYNYNVELDVIGVPSSFDVTISPKSIKPDTKSKIMIGVPKESKDETNNLQIVAKHKGQIVAATRPYRIEKGWKHNPNVVNKASLKKILPLSIELQTSRKQDKSGTSFVSDIDLILDSNVTPRLNGNANLRFSHDWSPKDNIDNIDLRTANISYLTGIFNVTLGRLDIAPIIQPGEYFGSYLTLGQRRFDGIFFLMPIQLFGSAGVDAQGFEFPPVTIMAGYFPNFFSFYPDNKEYDNGYMFSELKLPINILNYPLIVAINYAITTDYAYIKDSPLSGDPALSASYEYTYSKNYSVYGEFAIGNINAIEHTTALMTGASAKNLNAFTWGIIDEIAVEYQIPLISSTDNPFTGGNLFFPDQGEQQQGAWYARVKSTYDNLEFTFAITNSVGDFTFARVSDTAFDPNSNINLNDLRSANEVEELGKTLLSAAYDQLSYLISVKARF